MSDDHDPQESISVVPSVLAFAATAVVTFGGMALALIWNHQGGF